MGASILTKAREKLKAFTKGPTPTLMLAAPPTVCCSLFSFTKLPEKEYSNAERVRVRERGVGVGVGRYSPAALGAGVGVGGGGGWYPDRGMYFILRLTQLIVRPDSR